MLSFVEEMERYLGQETLVAPSKTYLRKLAKDIEREVEEREMAMRETAKASGDAAAVGPDGLPADWPEFGSDEHIAGLSREALESDFRFVNARLHELENTCERLDAENRELRESVIASCGIDPENVRQRLLAIFNGSRATLVDRIRVIEYLDSIEAENAKLRIALQSHHAKRESVEGILRRFITNHLAVSTVEHEDEMVARYAEEIRDALAGDGE